MFRCGGAVGPRRSPGRNLVICQKHESPNWVCGKWLWAENSPLPGNVFCPNKKRRVGRTKTVKDVVIKKLYWPPVLEPGTLLRLLQFTYLLMYAKQ